MQVAGYALENPDEIAFGTVASIAASAEVQPSALVRFSRALGYQGFTDLQDVFRSRLRDRVLNYDERLAQMRDHGIATSKSGLVLDGFLEASEQSIAKFRSRKSETDRCAASRKPSRTRLDLEVGMPCWRIRAGARHSSARARAAASGTLPATR